MRTAVVLGAGGITGHAFHAGALRALEQLTGFDARTVEVLVGTSAGSYVAASLAAGLSAADQASALTGEPLSPEGKAIRARVPLVASEPDERSPAGRGPLDLRVLAAAGRRPLRAGTLAAGLLPAGRHSTASLRSGIEAVAGSDWPTRDLRVCAIRVRDGRRVVFGTPGAPDVTLGTAVAASCAIPAYYRPVRVDGEAYVDGGMHSPTNADVLVKDALDLVVVLSPMSAGPRHGARKDLAVRLAVRRYLAREVHLLRRSGAEVVVLQPTASDLDVMGINPMRGDRAAEVVVSAEQSVRERLEAQPALVRSLAHK